MKKIRKSDLVYVIAGDHKGTVAKVEKVKGERAWLERVNMVTRCKKNPEPGKEGFKINKTMPIHISNLALSSEGEKPYSKVKIEVTGKEKFRVFKSNDKRVD